MQSGAATVEEYLDELPPDRRDAMEAVLAVVRANLPAGYEEAMNWGMICWQVPLERFPDTYNGQPLQYAALASQKRHMSLYLQGVYGDPAGPGGFAERWEATGRKLDMGKSCVRFRRLDDVPLDVVGDTIASVPLDAFVARYEATRGP